MTREIELAHEDPALQGALFFVLLPVVIETDFADGDDLFHFRPRGKTVVIFRRHRTRLFRMYADGRIDGFMPVGKSDAAGGGLDAVAHREDLHDAGRSSALDHSAAVVCKLFGIEMCMGIHKLHHFTLLPAAAAGSTSESPSAPEAQSSMPCERMPRIFAGLRFATRTTFRPTSSSGA